MSLITTSTFHVCCTKKIFMMLLGGLGWVFFCFCLVFWFFFFVNGLWMRYINISKSSQIYPRCPEADSSSKIYSKKSLSSVNEAVKGSAIIVRRGTQRVLGFLRGGGFFFTSSYCFWSGHVLWFCMWNMFQQEVAPVPWSREWVL